MKEKTLTIKKIEWLGYTQEGRVKHVIHADNTNQFLDRLVRLVKEPKNEWGASFRQRLMLKLMLSDNKRTDDYDKVSQLMPNILPTDDIIIQFLKSEIETGKHQTVEVSHDKKEWFVVPNECEIHWSDNCFQVQVNNEG